MLQCGADGAGRRGGTIGDQTTPAEEQPKGTSGGLFQAGSGRLRIGAVVAIVVAGGLLGWLLTRGGHHTPKPIGAKPGQVLRGIPQGVHVGPSNYAADGLKATVLALHQPAYWVGPKAGFTYEIERNSDGNLFITYIPPGGKQVSGGGKYLSVSTYPLKSAADKLTKVANKAGATIVKLKGGAIAVVGQIHAHSIYVAYPGSDSEIEVYSPSLPQARKLVLSGALRPVG